MVQYTLPLSTHPKLKPPSGSTH